MAKATEQQITADLKKVTWWLVTVFFLGWVALILRILLEGLVAHSGNPAYRDTAYAGLASETGTAFIWTLAWLTGGFLLGFIFGIPKVVATGSAGENTSSPAGTGAGQGVPSKLRVNTNLEEISDWLTKILVGASLTQIVKIPGAIRGAAQFMSSSELMQPVSFNAALLVYYSALGILSGYILTRMFFARAFALSDQNPVLSEEEARALDETPIGLGAGGAPAQESASLRQAAMTSNAVPITESLSSSDAVRLAKAASLTGDRARALTASKLAVDKSPDDPSAQLTYAWALHTLGAGIDTIIPMVERVAHRLPTGSNPSILANAYNLLSYLRLYQPPPNGFEKALEALAEYDARGGRADAVIEINRACAYGQKFAYLRARASEGDVDEIQKARDGALSAIRKALAADPASASRLKELMWVTADPADSDLSVFQSDEAFKALLPQPR